jgi:3-oxoacyl-[acyl-carrier-protein] synthase II
VDVVVTGIGMVTALGATREQTWSRLLAGETGIQLQQPYRDLAPMPLALVANHPTDLKTLLIAALDEAITDANLAPLSPDTGLVIGSSRGQQPQLEAIAQGTRPSSDWLVTYGGSPGAIATQHLGLSGIVLAPRAACATGLWAIAQGAELLRLGQCQQVITGAVEAPITPLTLAGFAKMGALAKTGCYPFDVDREGFVLGEGATVLVMETATQAQQRGQRIYGTVLGFGASADGYHVSAPSPDQRHALHAIDQCLVRSDLLPTAIDFIHAHGTATPLNDANEAALIQARFPTPIAVRSTKGATGHPLGASGALGTAFSLLTLTHQTLPPNTGLQHPAFGLDFGLNGRKKQESSALRYGLCLSFGFGGQNAAIALAKVNS